MSSSTEPASINETLLDDSLYVNSCLYQHITVLHIMSRAVPHYTGVFLYNVGIKEGTKR